VGGGITFGPVPHDFSLSMPVRMKRKALACALTSQYEEGNVIVVDGFENLKPKTKFMAKAIRAVAGDSSLLLVTVKDASGVLRITRNIASVDITPATDMTTYEVLAHKKIVFMKDAVGIVAEIITKKI
jgi:large subunit ribosomal protein L4